MKGQDLVQELSRVELELSQIHYFLSLDIFTHACFFYLKDIFFYSRKHSNINSEQWTWLNSSSSLDLTDIEKELYSDLTLHLDPRSWKSLRSTVNLKLFYFVGRPEWTWTRLTSSDLYFFHERSLGNFWNYQNNFSH